MWMLAALYFLSPRDAVSTIAVNSAANTAISISITHQVIIAPPMENVPFVDLHIVLPN